MLKCWLVIKSIRWEYDCHIRGQYSFDSLQFAPCLSTRCLCSIKMENKDAPRKRKTIQFWCCVPSCKCGYNPSKRNISFFTVPDPRKQKTVLQRQLAKKRLKLWSEAIGCEVQPGSRICEWHFLYGMMGWQIFISFSDFIRRAIGMHFRKTGQHDQYQRRWLGSIASLRKFDERKMDR